MEFRRILPSRGIARLPLRVAAASAAALASVAACASAPTPASQNPSPMVEHTRVHTRLDTTPPPGTRFTIDGLLPRPVAVFVPARVTRPSELTLVIHFHGAPYVPMHAAAAQEHAVTVATVNLGAGSAVYERAFAEEETLARLRQAVLDSIAARMGARATLSRTLLTGFSAGYGAIRAILRLPSAAATIDGVLLLDGLHASYVPDRSPLAEGGVLDTARLVPFADFARAAARGERRMVITHSEIFPGTFASTTETSDHLLRELGLRRTPVLAWGPGGMQQLSEASSGRFEVLGFAGNTAPDHIDHFHGMPVFLARLLAMQRDR